MKWLGTFRRRFDDTQFVERGEDNSFCATEFGLKDLNHGDLGPIELQNAPSRTRRSLVYGLSQLDYVEGGDFVGYCHGSFMLRGGVGSYQPRRSAFKGVMPGKNHEGAATVERELGLLFADNAERRAVADLLDYGFLCGFREGLPNELSIIGVDAENTAPFWTVSFHPQDPVQLGLLEPGICRAGKRVSNFRWPWHGSDARDRGRARVRHRQILRASSHTKVGRGR